MTADSVAESATAPTAPQDAQPEASTLAGANVLLGVSGGIAAYKSAELVRQLTAQGAEVQVVMTAHASEFIGPLTLQALSGRPVRNALFDPAAEAAMGHIELARWADLVLIAPATANTMANVAAGTANDLLCTLCLATAAPIAIAPAMNQQMWAAPATQRNVATLRGDGVEIFGPGSGDQACGDVGMGRMLEPQQIADLAAALYARSLGGWAPAGAATPQRRELDGVHVMITAGPTREALDPVRYISNHSTGKQGFELARAFAAAGATVTLVAGPVQLTTPTAVDRVDVTSAQDMFDAVMASIDQQHIFIAVAAVADYRPQQVAHQKIKKEGQSGPVEIALVQNPDIVASVAALDNPPFTVGFAAETHEVLEHARAKRIRKGLDAIIVNDVSDQSIGFSSDHNAVTVIWDDAEQPLPRAPKDALSQQISAVISERFWERRQRTGAKPDTRR